MCLKALLQWALFSEARNNFENCFCCSCRGEVLHCATRSGQLGTICAVKAWRNSLALRTRWSVGFTKKYARSESIALQVAGELMKVQRRLQVATIVAKSRTEFYFVKRFAQQKQCVANCRVVTNQMSFVPRNWPCHGSPIKDTRCGMRGNFGRDGGITWPLSGPLSVSQ